MTARQEITRPDKVLYPGPEVTKADLAAHFEHVAEVMLPHLSGRPLVLHRFPDGIEDSGFYQKQAPSRAPDFVDTVTVDADNDPPPRRDLDALRRALRATRDLFVQVGLAPYLMATGGSGYHVVAPLARRAGFDEVRGLARAVADRLAAADPDALTTEQRVDARGGRIFLDTNRNAYAQTAIAPYSPRARPGAPVATPIEFSELGRVEPDGYDLAAVRRRIARNGDPWADMAAQAVPAGKARRTLDDLS